MKRALPALTLVLFASCDVPTPPTPLADPASAPSLSASTANSDIATLAILHHATDGDDWHNDENWLENNDLTTWYGVGVGDGDRVTSLSLGGNNLSGQLPDALGNLDSLRFLYLSANDLVGSLPTSLGDLDRLETLYIAAAGVSGRIPSTLGNPGNALTGLLLFDNDLSGSIPPELGSAEHLEVLYLSGNRLSGSIPPELGRLRRLGGLHLNHNRLTGQIPRELGGLRSVREMDLRNNDLSGPIPSTLGNLTSATFLGLDNNRLSGAVPATLGDMGSLRHLYLSNNTRLSGRLDPALAELPLVSLMAGGTGLCAPSDAGFLNWLRGIRRQRVALCDVPAAYLVQSVQSRSFPVPLVAGEKALLRVFLTAERATGAHIPKIRARFYRDDRPSFVTTIPAKNALIPTQVDEGDLDASANIEIPGRVIQPGLEMVIEIDPDSTLDLDALGVPARIPESGRLMVDARFVPLFDLTQIPFLWETDPDSSIISQINDMADDPRGHPLLRQVRTLLPVGDLHVTAHDPVTTSTNDVYDLLAATYAIRIAEGARGGYYMGMMSGGTTGGASGVAYMSRPVSFSIPSVSTMAHEIGHNMGLWHAPCGGPNWTDHSYPDPAGRIGVWGYDFDTEATVPPSHRDLMSYCGPEWVSDFHFSNATGFRAGDELPKFSPQSASSLLLWGGRSIGGTLFLEPAFVVDAPSFIPETSGDHRLVGRTAYGQKLFDLSFNMPEMADTEGEYASFAFALAIETDWESIEAITLSGPSRPWIKSNLAVPL